MLKGGRNVIVGDVQYVVGGVVLGDDIKHVLRQPRQYTFRQIIALVGVGTGPVARLGDAAVCVRAWTFRGRSQCRHEGNRSMCRLEDFSPVPALTPERVVVAVVYIHSSHHQRSGELDAMRPRGRSHARNCDNMLLANDVV